MSIHFIAGFLAIVSLLGFLGILILMMYSAVPPGNAKYFDYALIGLLQLCGTSFGYYLGSSQGSKLKTELAAANQKEQP